MQPFDDAVIDQRLRQYYDAMPLTPRAARAVRIPRPVTVLKRRLIAGAAAAALLAGTAVAAREDVRATAMSSIERALSVRFGHPVREARQAAVDPGVLSSRLAQAGLELPKGLPNGAAVASVRMVNDDPGWLLVTYRVTGRSGDAVFSLASKRASAATGGNVPLDDASTPVRVRFASWETPTERVMLFARGDALTEPEIAAIKAASGTRNVR
jgi:hypothetical protein